MARKLKQLEPLIVAPPDISNGVAVSADSSYVAVGNQTTAPYLTIYKQENGKLLKLADPDVLPPSQVQSASFSPDGQYLAIAHSVSPFITIYKRNGDSFTKLANPASLPASTGQDIDWSSDSTYLAIGTNTAALIVYKRSGDTFTKLTDITGTAVEGQVNGIKFSPDTTHVYLTIAATPYIAIFKRTNDSFVRLANPSTLPPASSRRPDVSPDGVYVAVPHGASPFVTIYKRNGDTLTKLSNPDILPPSTGYGASFSPDGQHLAVVTLGAVGIVIYKRTGDTFTKIVSPAIPVLYGPGKECAYANDGVYLYSVSETAPYLNIFKRDGDTYTDLQPGHYATANTQDVAFTPDGNYLAVGSNNSGNYLKIYKKNKNNTFTKLTDPATLPTNNTQSVRFTPDGMYLATGMSSTPYMMVYRQDGGVFMKLNNPSTLPPSSTAIVAITPDAKYVITSSGGPTINAFLISGDNLIKQTGFNIQPTGTVMDMQVSTDSKYVVIATNIAPFLFIYKNNNDGTFTKLPDPAVAIPGLARSASFSPDGTKLVIAHSSSPYMTIYGINTSNDTFTKLPNPSVLLASHGVGGSFAFNGQYFVISSISAPYIHIYEVSGDVFTKIDSSNIALPDYLPKIRCGGNLVMVKRNSVLFPYVMLFEWERFLKFLIQDGTILKKFTNNAWSTIGVSTDAYSKTTFDTHGMSDLSVITNAAMQQLTSTNPEILAWRGIEEGLTPTQLRTIDQLVPKLLKQKDDVYVGGADSFKITAIEDGGIIRVILSDDNGVTWKGKGAVSITDPVSVKTNGWTVTELNALSRVIIQSITDKYKYKFAFYMEQVDVDKPLAITNFEVKTYEGWIPLGSVIPDSDTFTFSGLDNFTSVPSSALDSQFEVVAKRLNTTIPLDISVNAVAFGQLITPKGDIKIEDVINIDSLTLTFNKSGSGNIRIAVSFDSGVTWKGWNSGFTTMNINTQMTTYGITPETFNTITSAQWQAVRGTSETVRFAYFIEMANTSDIAEIDKLAMQGDMKGMWKKAIHGTDYDYHYSGPTELRINLMQNGSFKINY